MTKPFEIEYQRYQRLVAPSREDMKILINAASSMADMRVVLLEIARRIA